MQPGLILDPKQTVADLVLEHSECAQVFKKRNIDFCCKGDVSLADAAAASGIALSELLGELTGAINRRSGELAPDMREVDTPALIDHIVATHHEYLRQALPLVRGLAAKVCRVHGAHNPKLYPLNAAVYELADSLIEHLDDEEENLFPALLAERPAMDELKRQLDGMFDEHVAVAKLLERIRQASDGFALPEWACNSYRTLFSELHRLESDIFTHVHLENHVLKPRFTL